MIDRTERRGLTRRAKLGDVSTQDSSAVSLTGGSISGVALSGVTITYGLQSVSSNVTLSDTYPITRINATGKTLTLPACSAARISRTWTINSATTGSFTVTRASTNDYIITPTSTGDSSVQVYGLGASLSLMCVSTAAWMIV